jgi:NAD(P)-dependent dehydrogenase (short-subunit alcohol dehydrogenase family)
MALAREVARKGVTVNCVSPGYCDRHGRRDRRTGAQPVIASIRSDARRAFRSPRRGFAAVIGFITGANIPSTAATMDS